MDILRLKNLSLNIQDGEFLVFVGPSGCGKSSVLRMLAGLEDISAGKLIIGGEVVNDRTPQERNIAMVFQNYALYPHMTVGQNMEFPLKMLKIPPSERKQRVIEAAEILGLTSLLKNKPNQMSGGQRQRVAMGRAIVRNPSVFLMDEPLSNLDAKMRVQIRAEIAQLQERLGTTTVYVTHDQVEAMTMGDRVAVMRGGELQQIAPPQELYDSPANTFVGTFIGSPGMNIFRTQLSTNERGEFIIDFTGQPLSLASETLNRYQELKYYLNKKILVGLRPESFFLHKTEMSGGHKIEVEVDTIEYLGHEMIIYFHGEVDKVGVEDNRDGVPGDGMEKNEPSEMSSVLIARVATDHEIKRGQKLTLGVEINKLYLFDTDGKALIG